VHNFIFLVLLLLYLFSLYCKREAVPERRFTEEPMSKITVNLAAVAQIHGGSDIADSSKVTKEKVAVINGSKGKTVTCMSGRLWITQEGDPVDYVLEPNQSLVLVKAGNALVSGFGEATFRVA